MSSRKRSRADDASDEDEAGRHASTKKQVLDGAGGGRVAVAAAAATGTTAPFAGVMPKPKKLSAAERARLAKESLAAQQKAWKGESQPTAGTADGAAMGSPPSAAAASSPATKGGGAKAATRLSAEERRRLAQQSLALQNNSGALKGGPAVPASANTKPNGGAPGAVGAVAAPRPAATSSAASPAAAKSASRPARPPPKPSPAQPQWKPFVSTTTGVGQPTRAAVAAAPAATAASAAIRRPSQQPPMATVSVVTIQRPSVAPAPSVHHEEQLLNEDGADVFHVEAPKQVGLALRWIVYLGLGFAALGLLYTALESATSRSKMSFDLAEVPKAITRALWDQRPPCFDASFATDGPAVPVADHCTQPDTEFLPCPPHSICEGGRIASCDNLLWVLQAPTSSSSVPSRCEPSTHAASAVSRVTKLLEAWSWPSTCEGRPDAPSPPETRQGAAERVMFLYGELIAALHDDEVLSQVEANQFGDVARGKLSVLWDTDESGAPVLWLGLLPSHTNHLPASCRAANVIVSLAGSVTNLAYSAVKVGVVKPIGDGVTFVGEVFRVIYRTYPLGVTLSLIWAVVGGLFYLKLSKRRSELKAFQADFNLARDAAIEMLKREREPLRCLALRDDLREQLEGELQSHHFNTGVWPQVRSDLERDQRISLVLVRGDESFLWAGPKSQ